MHTPRVIAVVVGLEPDPIDLGQAVVGLAHAFGATVRLVHVGAEQRLAAGAKLVEWYGDRGVAASMDWTGGQPASRLIEDVPAATHLALSAGGPPRADTLSGLALRAIRHARLPTLVVPTGGRLPAPSCWRVLFPTDFSELANGALRALGRLCDDLAGELDLVHVTADAADPARAEIALGRLHRLSIPMSGPVRHHLVAGADVGETVAAEAGRLASDLIVLPTHRRSGLSGILRASVAESVVRWADRPVLVLRPD